MAWWLLGIGVIFVAILLYSQRAERRYYERKQALIERRMQKMEQRDDLDD
jgi:cytidylate kinase